MRRPFGCCVDGACRYHGLKLRLLSELGLYNRIVQLEKATDFTEPWLLNELQNEPTVTSV